MKKQALTWNNEAAVAIQIQPRRRAFHSHLNLIKPNTPHDKARIIVSVQPRRPACLTRHAMLAALREAELAGWQSSGDDCLAGRRQPID